MKKKENEVRNIFVKIRMNQEELTCVKKYQGQTTEKSLSEYIRSVAMRKPVIVNYRNQSADDFLKQMLALKKELNAIGNNFNQAVHKLHILDKIPEFRGWIQNYDGLLKAVVSKTDEIKIKVSQLYEQWLRK